MEIKKADSKGRISVGKPGEYFYVVEEGGRFVLIPVPKPPTVLEGKVQLTDIDLQLLRQATTYTPAIKDPRLA